jgi:hypothetical protein
LIIFYVSASIVYENCLSERQGYLILGTSEDAGSAASLPGFGVSPKNSSSFFLPAAAGGKLENEIALSERRGTNNAK